MNISDTTRIERFLAMDEDDVKKLIAVGIENPEIYEQFVNEEELNWDYAVAAQVVTADEVKWIKESEES